MAFDKFISLLSPIKIHLLPQKALGGLIEILQRLSLAEAVSRGGLANEILMKQLIVSLNTTS